jgi:hypothetical protein
VCLVSVADAQDRLVPRPGVPDPVIAQVPGKKAVVVPGYVPRPSDRASLVSPSDQAVVIKTLLAIDVLIKHTIAQDEVGLGELMKQGKVALVAAGTRVHVLDESEQTYKGADYTCYQVRFLDGPYQGQTAWCLEGAVGRIGYVPKTRAELKAERDAAPKAKPPQSPTAEHKAEVIMRAGEEMEKRGMTRDAIENYEFILKYFPETRTARKADEHLKAIRK